MHWKAICICKAVTKTLVFYSITGTDLFSTRHLLLGIKIQVFLSLSVCLSCMSQVVSVPLRAEEQSGAFRCGGGGAGDAQRPEADSVGKTGVPPSGRPAGVTSRALGRGPGGGQGGGHGCGVSCRPCEFMYSCGINVQGFTIWYSRLLDMCLNEKQTT